MKTPSPVSKGTIRAGSAEKHAHAAAVSSGEGDQGAYNHCESMRTAHIDTQSPPGSWAAILPFCRYVKVLNVTHNDVSIDEKGK